MYEIRGSGKITPASECAMHILCVSHILRYRKVASYSSEVVPGGSHKISFKLTNGESFDVLTDSFPYAFRCGVIKRLESLSPALEHHLVSTWDRLTAIYWVASQQFWKDLAEDFVPYIIASIDAAGGGVDGSNEKKKPRLNY
jgi:hypothetical protein